MTPVITNVAIGEGCFQQTDDIGDGCLVLDAPRNSVTGSLVPSALDSNGNMYAGGGIYVRSIGAPLTTQSQPSNVSLSCTPETYGSGTLCSVSANINVTGTVSIAYPNTTNNSVVYTSPVPMISGAASVPLPTSKLIVGGYPVVVTYNGDATYVPSTAAATLMVSQQTPAVNWPALLTSIQYGTPLSVEQLNASSSASGVFTYNPGSGAVLPVGSNTITAMFVPSDSINVSSVSVSQVLQVIPAIPSISWPAPMPIQYGTVLSSSQLNATANVAGTFIYNPPVGTLLQTGPAQTLAVTFTPVSSGNNSSNQAITANVLIDVNGDNPLITGLMPNPAVVGQALSISGQHFGPSQGSSSVTVNGVTATISSWSDSLITLPVPVGSATGKVIVTVGLMPSNSFLLMLVPAACPMP